MMQNLTQRHVNILRGFTNFLLFDKYVLIVLQPQLDSVMTDLMKTKAYIKLRSNFLIQRR